MFSMPKYDELVTIGWKNLNFANFGELDVLQI